jgi:tetratricopeptide (TPR) repeat protein
MDLETKGVGVDFVGREEERRALDSALARALRFRAPQFVTVLATAGMGKTRVLQEWLGKVDGRGEFAALFARGGVSPTNAEPEAYGVLARLLRQRFGIETTTPDEDVQARLRAGLQAVFADRRVSEIAGLMGRFLGMGLPESPLAQSLAMRPDQQSDLARAVLCRFLEEDARQRPLMMVVDDAHLADDDSLDVLARLAEEVAHAPLVVVFAARPDLLVRHPDWIKREGSHTRVDLKPLAPLEMDVFIKGVLAADALAPGLSERAAIESKGNPLLLGQLLRMYQQNGILVTKEARTWTFDADRAAQVRPQLSPEAAAQAHLAELSPAERDVLVRAAAMGPTFWPGALVALARMGADPWDPNSVFAPDPSIEATKRICAALAEAGFVHQAASNLLACDAALEFAVDEERALIESLVTPETMCLRRRFSAQWIEARLGSEPSSEQLEYVAALYEQGEDRERAARTYVSAGDQAARLRRYERARVLYVRAARLLDGENVLFRIETCHKLGDAASRLGRSREALAHFGEMLKGAWRLDLPGKGGAAHGRIGRVHRALGDYRLALRHLDMAHLLFDLAGDRPGVAASLDDIGRIHYLMGAPVEALRCHRTALNIREELGDQRGQALTLSWLALVQAQMGELRDAEENLRKALTISQATGDAQRALFTLIEIAGVSREAGHPESAHRLLEQARGMARKIGERLNECHLALQIGDCLVAQDRLTEAEGELTSAKEIARKFGARRLLAEADRGLAELCLVRGDCLGARHHADAAALEAEKIGATPLLGTALRLLATALTQGAPADARHGGPREVFERAVDLLGKAGAQVELGRTLASYAEFEKEQGRLTAADELRERARHIRERAGLAVAAPEAAAQSPM